MLEGGLPEGSSVVLQGPPGQEKLLLALTFLAEGLKEGSSGLLVLSSQSAESILTELRKLGVDLDAVAKESRLRIVDWYSWSEETVADVEERGIILRSSMDLANAGAALSRAIASLGGDKPKRAIVEILSPATNVFELSQVYAFAQSSKRKFDRFSFTSLFILEKEMHTPAALSTLHQPFDGVIEMERVRSGDRIVRKIGVLHLKDTTPGTTFFPLVMTDKGFRVIDSGAASADRVPPEGKPAAPAPGPGVRRVPPRAPLAQGEAVAARTMRVHLIMDIAQERLNQDPMDADALFALAAAQATLGDTRTALESLRRLAEINEQYPGLWVLKAKLHARVGEEEEWRQARMKADEFSEPSVEPTGDLVACPVCQKAIARDASLCPHCGSRMDTDLALFEELEKLTADLEIPAETPEAPEEAAIPEALAELEAAMEGTEEPAEEAPTEVAPEETAAQALTKVASKHPEKGPSPKGLTNGNVLRRSVLRRSARSGGAQGRTNGLTNGLRGRTNGLTNGLGRTNGLTNGLGRTNGLTNGLRGRTNGLTNGLGRTNGLTNGLGRTNGITGRTTKKFLGLTLRSRWQRVAIAAAVAAILIVPVFMLFAGSPPPYAIQIDGQFGDWPVQALVDLPGGGSVDPNVRIVRFGIADNVDYLAFYVEVAGTAFQGGGSPPGRMDTVFLFVDTDNSSATGYQVEGIGADRLIEVAGHGGRILWSSLHEFDANRDVKDWNGWIKSTSVPSASAGAKLEVEAAWIDLRQGTTWVRATVRAQAWDGQADEGEVVLSPTTGTLAVDQEPTPSTILSGASVPLLSITTTAYRQAVSFESLHVQIVGTAPPNAATSLALVDSGGNVLTQVVPVSRDVVFRFAPERVDASNSRSYTVRGSFSISTGDTYGVTLASAIGVGARDGIAMLQTLASAASLGYVGAAPTGARVDGAFNEWASAATDALGESTTGGNANIDLARYGALHNGTSLYLYTDVSGRIFTGTGQPVEPRLVTPNGTAAADTDRDTVPDSVDPMPYDFNNDGTPDAQTNGDYDADGVTDYGFAGGTDYWLNTTLPGSFPAPYAGLSVSVYIGPTTKPPLLGEDVLRVFLDLDNSSFSGYSIGGLGADRLVEIRGKDGQVTQSAFLSFSGSFPGQWSWSPISPVTVALAYHAVELSVPGNASGVYVETGDFWGSVDSTSVTTALPAQTSFSVAAATTALSVPWIQTGPTPSVTLIDGSSDSTTTVYNHQRKVVRAGDVAGQTACDATNSDGCWYVVLYDRMSEVTATTAASTETITTGSKISGTFPGDISSEDGAFIQYREGGADPDHYPGTETLTTGTGCGGTFPTDLLSSNNAYRCLREGTAGGMSLAFDATSNGTGASVTSFSWSHTTSGSNRLLVVGISVRQVGSTTVTGVTYDGTALTFIRADTSATQIRSELWYLIAPATGTKTIQVTLNATENAVGGAVTFSGAAQSTPIGNHGGGTGSSTTPSVTITSASGEIVVDNVAAFQAAASPCAPGSGQTERWDTSAGVAGSAAVGCGSTEPGASSVTMDWTLSASKPWAISAVSVKPADNYQLSARHDWSSILTDGASYDLCVEAHITSGAGESILVDVLTPASTWNTRLTVTKTSDDNTDQCYTLTTGEFNSGAPSIRWSGGTESGDGVRSDVNIDHERIIRRLANKQLEVRYDWSGVPPGDTYALRIKGYRQDEDINVQVLTPPSTWNTRITMSATVNTLYTYTLATSEYNSGAPSIRFMDASGGDVPRSDLWIDLATVATTSFWDRIVLMRSADISGSTWGSQIVLASGRPGDSPLLYSYDSSEPSIAIDSSGYLHVVWVSASATGNQNTFDRIRYTRTTVAYPTQSQLASASNWNPVTVVDDSAPGFMPTVSTDSNLRAHIAWSSSKTSGTVYYKNRGPDIAFDAASSATGSSSSLTWSHTTSGSNRLLVVGVSFRQAGSTVVSSVTYAGTGLSFIRADTNAGNVRSELWYLVAPATGANNVVVTLSGSERIVGGAVSYTGASQSAPIGTNGGATGTSATPSVTISSSVNEIVMDVVGATSSTAGPCTPGSGQTERWDATSGSGAPAVVGCGSTESGASSVVMDRTLALSQSWAISAVSLKPVGWRPTVSWGTAYTGLSVDVSPQNDYVNLVRYYDAATNEIQYAVCKNLASNDCDASSEFTKWDGTAGYDPVATSVESYAYPSLATTYEANGDVWIAYAKDVDGSTRAIYARFLNYPSTGFASAETVDSLSGTRFTRPTIGVDMNGNVHALYVDSAGPQLYYKLRSGGSWGSRASVGTSSDYPSLMVRAPNNATYGIASGAVYWKTSASETYFYFIPEFEDLIVPVAGVLLVGLVLSRRARARKKDVPRH